MEDNILSRDLMIKALKSIDFDVVVIGGGITGAGVARDASLRGLSVGLLEKGDFGSGTSSASTKMLHGGLRYLKNYEFRLVREAALERRVHLEIAPHLCEVMQFLVPLYDWNPEPTWMMKIGLFLYDLLAFPKGIGRHKFMNRSKLTELLPMLENDNLKAGAMYADVKTDDARLVLSNILSAVDKGAKVANYSRVTSWELKSEGVELLVQDLETGDQFTVSTKSLVIAAGPWTEIVENHGINFEGKAKLRTTWGSHLLLKKKLEHHPVLIVNDDGRPIFLIPRNEYDLAGTTDVDYQGHPDDLRPPISDVQYILDACNKVFPQAKYKPSDVVAIYTGLRPLVYRQGVKEGKISRNHSIFVDNQGVITVVGGKLTTYRVMAQQTVDKAIKFLGKTKGTYKCKTDRIPLWGGNIEDWDTYLIEQGNLLRSEYGLDESSAMQVVRAYGSELPTFLQILKEHGTAKLDQSKPWLEAQVIFACRYEMISKPVDFMRRRTSIMLGQGNGRNLVDRITQLMAVELGWTKEYSKEMINDTHVYIQEFFDFDLSKIQV